MTDQVMHDWLVQLAVNRSDNQAAQKVHHYVCSLKSHSSSLEAKNKGLRQQLTEALKSAGKQRAMVTLVSCNSIYFFFSSLAAGNTIYVKVVFDALLQVEKAKRQIAEQFEKKIMDLEQQQQQQSNVQKASASSQTECIEPESKTFQDASTEASMTDEVRFLLIMHRSLTCLLSFA